MKDVSTEEEPILEQHIATIEEKENDEEASISDIQTDKLDVSAAASNVESNLENVMSAELPVQIQEQEVKIVENDTESEENTDNAAVSEILEQNSADINEPAEDKVENSEENALNELHTSATEEEKHIENTESENTHIETNMDKVTKPNCYGNDLYIKMKLPTKYCCEHFRAYVFLSYVCTQDLVRLMYVLKQFLGCYSIIGKQGTK